MAKIENCVWEIFVEKYVKRVSEDDGKIIRNLCFGKFLILKKKPGHIWKPEILVEKRTVHQNIDRKNKLNEIQAKKS